MARSVPRGSDLYLINLSNTTLTLPLLDYKDWK